MADDVAVARADELRALPERGGQRVEAERGVEVLAVAGHGFAGGEVGGVDGVGARVELCRRTPGRRSGCCSTICFFSAPSRSIILTLASFGSVGCDDVVDVAPLLRPGVAEQVRGDHAVGAVGGRAVLLDQLEADVGVQLVVEGLQLLPGGFELGGELRGGHVVAGAPEVAGVFEAELARALIGQLDEARVLVAHRRRDGVPAGPEVEQLFGVAGLGHEDADLLDAETFG